MADSLETTSAIDLVERLAVLANAEGGGPTADALDEAADTITRLQAALDGAKSAWREMIERGRPIGGEFVAIRVEDSNALFARLSSVGGE